jgi:flagellar biosynthesis/type III secretory pathway chaperone
MRRSYDPHYGSREQLRAQSEHGMKVARERDALKAENAELTERLKELTDLVKFLTEQNLDERS